MKDIRDYLIDQPFHFRLTEEQFENILDDTYDILNYRGYLTIKDILASLSIDSDFKNSENYGWSKTCFNDATDFAQENFNEVYFTLPIPYSLSNLYN